MDASDGAVISPASMPSILLLENEPRIHREEHLEDGTTGGTEESESKKTD